MLRRLTPTCRGTVRRKLRLLRLFPNLTAPSMRYTCNSSKATTTTKLNKLQPTIIELNKDHLHLTVFTERTLFYRNSIKNSSLLFYFGLLRYVGRPHYALSRFGGAARRFQGRLREPGRSGRFLLRGELSLGQPAIVRPPPPVCVLRGRSFVTFSSRKMLRGRFFPSTGKTQIFQKKKTSPSSWFPGHRARFLLF